MRINPVSGKCSTVPSSRSMCETPVRLWHWVMMVAMFFLAGTGYLINSPPAIGGEAAFHYMFGYIRMIHFIAAMVFAVAFLVRIHWAFVGNHSARAIFIPPLWNLSWWRGLFSQMGYYLFLKRNPTCGWVTSARADRDVRDVHARHRVHHHHGIGVVRRAVGLGQRADEPDGWVFVLFKLIHRWCARCTISRCGISCAVRGHPYIWCSARTS